MITRISFSWFLFTTTTDLLYGDLLRYKKVNIIMISEVNVKKYRILYIFARSFSVYSKVNFSILLYNIMKQFGRAIFFLAGYGFFNYHNIICDFFCIFRQPVGCYRILVLLWKKGRQSDFQLMTRFLFSIFFFPQLRS